MSDLAKCNVVIGCLAMLGVVAFFVFAGPYQPNPAIAQVQATVGYSAAVGTGLLTAGAAAAGGILVGFILGMPRSRASKLSEDRSNGTDSSTSNSDRSTQLDDIADWLSKLIVGAGLVELGKLYNTLGTLAHHFVSGFTLGDAVVAVGIYFSVVGFIAGYLNVQLFVRLALTRADRTNADILRTGKETLTTALAGLRDPITQMGEAPKLSDEAAKSAEAIRRIPLTQLHTADEYQTWAQAFLAVNDLASARLGYHLAVRFQPRSPRLHIEYAAVLALSSLLDEAEKELNIASSLSPSGAEQQQIAEARMFIALYRPAPQGFEEAIEIGERLRSQEGPNASSNVHGWLAAAYGQKYSWLIEHPPVDELKRQDQQKALDSLRDQTLAEMKSAIQKNSSWRFAFRGMLDRNSEARKQAPDDDDLEVFSNDQRFFQALTE